MQASTQTYLRDTVSRLYTAVWFAAAAASVGIGLFSVFLGIEGQ